MGLRDKVKNAKKTAPKTAPKEDEAVVEAEVEAVVEAPVVEAPVVVDEPKVSTSTSVAVSQETTVAVASGLPAGVDGEWDVSDTEQSYLSLVQKLGDLSSDFEYCSFVFDKQHQLADAGDPIFVVCVGITKYYQELVTFGEEYKTFSTFKEARDAGFEEGFQKDSKKVAKVADIVFLVAVEDDFDTDIEFNGTKFVLAKYVAKSTGYSVAKRIITAATRGILKSSLASGVFELSAIEKKDAKAAYAIPVLKNGKSSEVEIGPGFTQWAIEEGYAAG